MDSFYGGKQGISFVIRERFKCIGTVKDNIGLTEEEKREKMSMLGFFADSNYKDVWYGEYCIIDTPNKNDPDNGKVFRRTLNDPLNPDSKLNGLAEYIGQLVGPSSGIPIIKFGSLSSIESKFDSLGNEGFPKTDIVYYQDTEGKWNTEYPTDDTEKQNLLIQSSSTDGITGNIVFKSGREYGLETTETPALKYNYYTLQTYDANTKSSEKAEMQMGLEIPYVDFDFSKIIGIDPLQSPSVRETTDDSEERTDSNKFYRTYELSIPSGFPGGTIRNLREIDFPPEEDRDDQEEDRDDQYPLLWRDIDWTQHPPQIVENPVRWHGYENVPLEVPTPYVGKIWVCDFVSYDKNTLGTGLKEDTIYNIFISTEIQPTHIGVYPDIYTIDYRGYDPPFPTTEQEFVDAFKDQFSGTNPKEASLVAIICTEDGEDFTKYGMVDHLPDNTWTIRYIGTLQPVTSISAGLFSNGNYLINTSTEIKIDPQEPSYLRLNIETVSSSYNPTEPWS